MKERLTVRSKDQSDNMAIENVQIQPILWSLIGERSPLIQEIMQLVTNGIEQKTHLGFLWLRRATLPLP